MEKGLGLSAAQKVLLKSVSEHEKRLHSLKNDTITHAVEISDLQEELREKYQSLILQHPTFGTYVICKDIEEKLWKQCFYVKIEEYRKSIRKTVNLRDEREGIAANPAVVLKARAHLAKLISAFTKFLSDGSSFYQDFMFKLESGYKAHELLQSNGVTEGNSFVLCIYWCLMYLGDLARYRELYCDNKEKDYSEAERYYQRASFLSHTSGHPHNQLAMLASYLDRDCVAVYHYCRSVMILKPFSSGFDNLNRIFEKNMRVYSLLNDDITTRDENPASPKDKKKVTSMRAQAFFIRFIRFHGDLFKWTHNSLKAVTDRVKSEEKSEKAEKGDKGGIIEGGNNGGVNIEGGVALEGVGIVPYCAVEFDDQKSFQLVEKILLDLEYVIQNDESSILFEMLLVRLLAISIFSVHYSASLCVGNQKDADHVDRSVTESLALHFLFSFVSRCAALFGSIPTANKTIESKVRRVLPVLTVFSEWCALHPEYLGAGPNRRRERAEKWERGGGRDMRERDRGDRENCRERDRGDRENGRERDRERDRDNVSEKEGIREKDNDKILLPIECISPSSALLQHEREALAAMRISVTSLEELLHTSIISSGVSAAAQRGPKHTLKEEVELRGFLPLKGYHSVHSSSGLVTQPAIVPDELTRGRRLRDLLKFIEKLKLLPVPSVPMVAVAVTLPMEREENGRDERKGRNGREGRDGIDDVLKDSISGEKRPGLLSVGPGVLVAARQKERERERNIERSYTKMGEFREKDGKEMREQSGKKGRREESKGLDTDVREHRGGLLSLAPGVLVAAREKERKRGERGERVTERVSKIRGETRPGAKLVDTRTSTSTNTRSTRDDRRNRRSGAFRDARNAAIEMRGEMRGEVRGDMAVSGSIDERQDRALKEFPPLPGSRDVPIAVPLNYAASAVFSSSAPVNLDPFGDDSEESETHGDSDISDDEEDEEEEDDEEDEEEEDDEEDDDEDEVEEVGRGEGREERDEAGLDDYIKGDALTEDDPQPFRSYQEDNWNFVSNIGSNIGANVGVDKQIPPSFGGVFGALGNTSSTGSLFTEYSGQMDVIPLVSASHSVQMDDDEDDVVVFRPAFSRFNTRPSTESIPISFPNDISPLPSLKSYPMNQQINQQNNQQMNQQMNLLTSNPTLQDINDLNQNKSIFVGNVFTDNYMRHSPSVEDNYSENYNFRQPWDTNESASMNSMHCQPDRSNTNDGGINNGGNNGGINNGGINNGGINNGGINNGLINNGGIIGTSYNNIQAYESMSDKDRNGIKDEWWKDSITYESTLPPGLRQDLSLPTLPIPMEYPMEHASARGMRGPPALQHAPLWNHPGNSIGTSPRGYESNPGSSIYADNNIGNSMGYAGSNPGNSMGASLGGCAMGNTVGGNSLGGNALSNPARNYPAPLYAALTGGLTGGLSGVPTGGSTVPMLPPGLVPPPPGFANNGNNGSSGSSGNLQAQQYQVHRDSGHDSWTANPFYRSNG